MTRPKLLDLYGGEGGASEGYERAGWEVYAVDLNAAALRRNPAAGTHVGDVLEVLAILLAGGKVDFTLRDGSIVWLGLEDFDAIHASPPCQGYTIATAGNPAARAKHQRLIAATRDLLKLTGKPWVIENVEQARSQMVDPILLCGSMLGLATYDEDDTLVRLERHRLFESSVPLMSEAKCYHDTSIPVAGVYGGSRRARRRPGESLASVARRDRYAAKHERHGGYVPRSKRVQQELLGIDWMTVKGMQESIPPAYAERIGRQLLAHVEEKAA